MAMHLSLHYVFDINLIQVAVLHRVSKRLWYDMFACGVQCLPFIRCHIFLSKVCTVKDYPEVINILPIT